MGMEDNISMSSRSDGGRKESRTARRARQKKVFPGTPGQMIVNDRSWYVVRTYAGVSRASLARRYRNTLSGSRSQAYLEICGDGGRKARRRYRSRGGAGRPTNSGAFENFAATVAEVFQKRSRLVDMFGRGPQSSYSYNQVKNLVCHFP